MSIRPLDFCLDLSANRWRRENLPQPPSHRVCVRACMSFSPHSYISYFQSLFFLPLFSFPKPHPPASFQFLFPFPFFFILFLLLFRFKFSLFFLPISLSTSFHHYFLSISLLFLLLLLRLYLSHFLSSPLTHSFSPTHRRYFVLFTKLKLPPLHLPALPQTDEFANGEVEG